MNRLIFKTTYYFFNILLLFSYSQSVKAQENNCEKISNGSQCVNKGVVYNCGNQATGNVTCNNFPNTFFPEKANQDLKDLCSEENFGAIKNGVIIYTRKAYNVGEIIDIKYSDACPYKTEFLIVRANAPYTSRRNTIMRRRSLKVPSYNGEIRFPEDRISSPGTYAIQAYYTDNQRKTFLAGRSFPFEVVNNRM